MTTEKITQMTPVTAAQLSDLHEVVQGGVTYSESNQQRLTLYNSTIQVADPIQITHLYGSGVLSVSTNTSISAPFPSRIVCNTNSGVITLTLGAFNTNNIQLGQVIEIENAGSSTNDVIVHNSGGFQIASNIKTGATSFFRVSGINPDSLDNVRLGAVGTYNTNDTVPINISGNAATATTANSANTATTATTSTNANNLTNLNNALHGIVSVTGSSGGATTFTVPTGSTYSGTSFNNMTNGVGFNDCINFTNSGAITCTLDFMGLPVGFTFYINLTSTGTITFSGALGNTINGITTVTGGGTPGTSPYIRCSVVTGGAPIQWQVELTNSFGLIAGSNISISHSSSGATISTTGGSSLTYSTVSGTSQTMTVNQGYIPLNGALTTFTLPTTIAVGDMVAVAGYGSGGWKIAQNSGQQINLGSTPTTLGATGFLASTNQFDNIKLMCVVANTTFIAFSPEGNITVT
jgi:hypothetical protein